MKGRNLLIRLRYILSAVGAVLLLRINVLESIRLYQGGKNAENEILSNEIQNVIFERDRFVASLDPERRKKDPKANALFTDTIAKLKHQERERIETIAKKKKTTKKGHHHHQQQQKEQENGFAQSHIDRFKNFKKQVIHRDESVGEKTIDSVVSKESEDDLDNTIDTIDKDSGTKGKPSRRRRKLQNVHLKRLKALKNSEKLSRKEEVSFEDQIEEHQKLISFSRVDAYSECMLSNIDYDDSICSELHVHISISLDLEYISGATALINSIVKNASCPHQLIFHFMTTHNSTSTVNSDQHENSSFEIGNAETSVDRNNVKSIIKYYFPFIKHKFYDINQESLKEKIRAMDIRADDLENPLNYARIVMPLLLPHCIKKIIYLDTDMIVVGRIESLFKMDPREKIIASPEFCHLKAVKYFTEAFWSLSRNDYEKVLGSSVTELTPTSVFGPSGSDTCYFNPGVMVIDVHQWKDHNTTEKVFKWMLLHKNSNNPLYSLGSLPPLLLVFAGRLMSLPPSWNDHDYGCPWGCKQMPNPKTVNIVHWSCNGKPWRRIAELNFQKSRLKDDTGNMNEIIKNQCLVDFLYYKKYDVLGDD